MLAFYGVSSVDAWHAIWDKPVVAARRSKYFESCPGPASAWIRQGEIAAHATQCAEFSKENSLSPMKLPIALNWQWVFLPQCGII